jgi:hypothetical protein
VTAHPSGPFALPPSHLPMDRSGYVMRSRLPTTVAPVRIHANRAGSHAPDLCDDAMHFHGLEDRRG